MSMKVYESLLRAKANGGKMLAVLIDPDKTSAEESFGICEVAMQAQVDFFFVGSSLLVNGNLRDCVTALKRSSNIPVVLFPGSMMQVCEEADAILFLSLISGRNPDFLIGQQVQAAPMLRATSLEVIPTGYMLIDCGHPTSVTYMSQTIPIPHDKNDIASTTAMAGEMLGLKAIYLDAGSGARLPVSASMIGSVRRHVSVPVIAGGGIRTPEKAQQNCRAGADIIVIGNAVEENRGLVAEISSAIHSLQTI